MIEVSYSALSTFRSCKNKYRFKNELRLEPKREGPEITIGKTIHESFESLFKGKSIIECSDFISEKFNKAIGESLNPWETEDLIVGKAVSLGMWNFYPFGTVKFHKVFPEQRFRVPIPGFKDIFLVGYLDGLVVDTSQKYWIREVKTTGLNIEQAKERANVSYQSTGYVWALNQVLSTNVSGTFYDFIRKPLLRKNLKESCQDFADRNYQTYENPKNHKKLYGRHYSWRSEASLRQFEADLVSDVEDLLKVREKGYYARNTDACFMYGRECPYKKICFLDQLDKDMLDVYYNKRDRRFGADKSRILTLEDGRLI